MTLAEKILSRTCRSGNGCIVWLGVTHGSSGQYGIMWSGEGRSRGAHVLMWELNNGPIPIGYEIHHSCRNSLCVNPDHLEVVTHLENVRMGLDSNEPANRCVHGHEFTEENTIWRKMKSGNRCRECRICKNLWNVKYRLSKKIKKHLIMETM